MRRIPNTLIHPALTRGDGDALLSPEPVESDDDLARVAAAHAVGDDVHLVAGVAQIQGRLRDADVRLYADQGDGGAGWQDRRQVGCVHGELGLVKGSRGEEVGDGWDGGTKLSDGLGCGVDGDGEAVGELDEFLGGEDAVSS